MNQLQRLFEYHGKQLRTVIINEEIWFVAKDVCEILGIDTSVSVNGQLRKRPDGTTERSGGLDDDEKATHIVSTPGGDQEMIVVNEPGLYSLVLKSRKPEAKAFKRWVTHEVLPSIRKTGTYSVSQYRLPQSYAEALRMLADEVEQHERTKQQLSIAAPKAEMYDVALSAKNAQSMSIVAKTLGWGRNRLFAFLRDKGVLRHNNEPYQEYVERGYFVVRQVPISRSSGVQNKPQTLVTAKGMDYIGKLLKENGMLEGRKAE